MRYFIDMYFFFI